MSATTSTDLFRDKIGDTFKKCIIPHIWLSVSSLEIWYESLILRTVCFPFFKLPNIWDFKTSRYSIQDFLSFFFAKFAIESIHIDIFVSTYYFKEHWIIGVCCPWEEGTFCEGKIIIDDIYFSKGGKWPNTMTNITSSMVRIKGKIWKGEFFLGKTTEWTSSILMKRGKFFISEEVEVYFSFTSLKCER